MSVLFVDLWTQLKTLITEILKPVFKSSQKLIFVLFFIQLLKINVWTDYSTILLTKLISVSIELRLTWKVDENLIELFFFYSNYTWKKIVLRIEEKEEKRKKEKAKRT